MGNDSDLVFALLVLARWLHFACLFVLFGCSVFWLWVSPNRAALPWSAGLTRRIIGFAAPVAAASGVGWLVVSVATMTGSFAAMVDPETIHAFLFETPFGAIAIARLILLACLVVVAVAPMTSSLRMASIAVLSGMLMTSQAWLGHAAEGGDTLAGSVMIGAYAVHLLSAAAWVGGLPALALVLAERTRQGRGIHEVLARYSTMATLAVGLVVLSGIANTLFHASGVLVRLPFTSYGAVLLAKLSLVAAMLVIAAINRLILMPRLRAAHPSDPSDQMWLTTHPNRVDSPSREARGRICRLGMRATLAIELALAIVVLSAASVLGITPPPQ